ncbi:ribonuclease H [Thermosipho sp. 1063]|uniref:RNase H family protein n=1 Tax=unclassified Thermosipho (in: thermotogales) TaxID=2676525 RepID=UPI0009492424|nr:MULTISPECIES: RNase H family protein [unclassified Thermosipho (in: thermotogales)]ANQ54530.1 ribonuclease H [Thermosipho sp. 1070]APT72971.1 ribonuclease H [Thermosipho sp. 1063]OOC42421.1 ribonuclease H [Thermosipho sp. 1074]
MTIYVDGSYSNTYQVASCAFCVVKDGEIIDVRKTAKRIKKGNSVISELLGVVMALKYCKMKGISQVTIVHDYNEIPMFASSYRRTKNHIVNNYIKELIKLKNQIDVSFKKVKAHTNDKFNNLVDELSRENLRNYIEKELPKILKGQLKKN